MNWNGMRCGAAVVVLMAALSAEAAEWGRHATIVPGWARLRQSALRAARDPMTWIPAARGGRIRHRAGRRVGQGAA